MSQIKLRHLVLAGEHIAVTIVYGGIFRDPFVKVPEGELRLPGVGYAALHPELEGIDPEDYPEIHKLKILADVGPYTEKFKRQLIKVRAMKNKGALTEREEDIYKETLRQVSERKVLE